jgi:hypothetical protein
MLRIPEGIATISPGRCADRRIPFLEQRAKQLRSRFALHSIWSIGFCQAGISLISL